MKKHFNRSGQNIVHSFNIAIPSDLFELSIDLNGYVDIDVSKERSHFLAN